MTSRKTGAAKSEVAASESGTGELAHWEIEAMKLGEPASTTAMSVPASNADDATMQLH
jgi:hypothetical protein